LEKLVDADTLKRWMERGEATLIDVREPAEHKAERIDGAVSVPLAGICAANLPERAGKKLAVHCLKGGRGSKACEKLLAEDPMLEVYNLKGGISAWDAAGFPVKRSGSFFLPLDRQVQLMIGLCVLTAAVLAYFVSPAFLLVVGFFGFGLTIAGLTGFCGLARLVALMPWNQCTSSTQ
jgi:rhodanese-related sulfurtransferase